MATDTCGRKGIKPSQASAPPAESEHLPCPRCDSTNTKFCYYNNYNFSQPRHFCKSCRRYWTHGGTLRDVPVGGGSRKNSKRSRTSVAAATTASTGASTVFPSAHHDFHHMSAGGSPLLFPLVADHGGSLPFVCDAKMSGSFTSLLNNTQGNGLLTLGGYGLDDVGFGVGKGAWPFLGAVEGGPSGGNGWGSTVAGYRWQDENEEGGLVEGGDYFALPEPDLAISTPASVLK